MSGRPSEGADNEDVCRSLLRLFTQWESRRVWQTLACEPLSHPTTGQTSKADEELHRGSVGDRSRKQKIPTS
jgi:hypothetical protein